MILVFGSAFQGKLAYVREAYGVSESDIFTCREDSLALDAGKKVINRLHCYLLACLCAGLSPSEELEKKLPSLSGAVVVCDDIGAGIVPLSALERRWREENGRCLQLLAARADRVIRVFCSIPAVMKDA